MCGGVVWCVLLVWCCDMCGVLVCVWCWWCGVCDGVVLVVSGVVCEEGVYI